MSDATLSKKEILILSALIILAILILIFVFFDVSKLAALLGRNPSVTAAITEKYLPVFYYSRDFSGGGKSDISIYQLNSSFDGKDRLVKNLSGMYGFDNQISNNRLPIIKDRHELWALDLANGNLNKIIESKSGRIINHAKFISPQKIAYITQKDGLEERAIDSRLNIFDIDTNTEDEIFVKSESGLFSSFTIQSVSPDSNIFILLEAGGDGGLVWGSGYKVDLTQKTVKELKTILDDSVFEDYNLSDYRLAGFYNPPGLGVISPDGLRSVFVKNVNYKKESLDQKDFEGCLKSIDDYAKDGAMIVVYDIVSENQKEIYRNLDLDNNFCRNIFRRIDSLFWLDNSTILFSTPAAIYTIGADGDNLKKVYEFPSTLDPKSVIRSTVISKDGDLVIFANGEVLNLSNGKTEKILKDSKEIYFLIKK